jgi:hypothetical protein
MQCLPSGGMIDFGFFHHGTFTSSAFDGYDQVEFSVGAINFTSVSIGLFDEIFMMFDQNLIRAQ